MTDYRFLEFDGNTLRATGIFEDFTYPMGERTVRLTVTDPDPAPAYVLWVSDPHPDVLFVAQWADLVNCESPEARRVLVLPFLPGARGDKDTPSPAKVNAAMIAHTGITDLVTLDPHSPVWLDALRTENPDIAVHLIDAALVTVSAVVTSAISDGELVPVRGDDGQLTVTGDSPYRAVIAPDAGASARAATVAGILRVPVLTASKVRDPKTGRILSYDFPQELDEGERYLVVDDICDGGGTFIALAESFPSKADVDLWVSHGGFTKGISGTGLQRFRRVLTTDSLRSASQIGAFVLPLVPFIQNTLRDISLLHAV